MWWFRMGMKRKMMTEQDTRVWLESSRQVYYKILGFLAKIL